MIRSLFVASICVGLLVGAATPRAQAQDSLAAAKELYAAAAYEDALKMLDRIEGGTIEHATYRAYCLLALDRTADADKVVEEILLQDPLFAPNADEVSPRVAAVFDRVRTASAPAIARALFADGKAAFDKKEAQVALAKFELLLKIIEASGSAESPLLSELKLLASGYVDLARAALPAAKPASTTKTAPANGTPGGGTTGTSGAVPANGNGSRPDAASEGDGGAGSANGAGDAGAISPAVPISEKFPAYDARFIGRNLKFTGVLRVRITADGRVEGAELVDSVHPWYDRRLIDAALAWRYQPARKNGVPVPSTRLVAVNISPQ